MMAKIPARFQGVLWSANINQIDLTKDRSYVIHQVLSYGRLEDIWWLFKTYSKIDLIEVFLGHPFKNYTAARFNLVKNYLLTVSNRLDERDYVQNLPRRLR